ncbi:phosphatidylglycerophosphatase A [bacterium]|nr:phosphatidylglycerophosphatase A [bacterium]
MGILKKSVTAEQELTGGGFGGFAARFTASGMYIGYVPWAQGTAGSLWGPLLYLLVPVGALKWLWLGTPALFLLGVWASGKCEGYWGHDPGRVVIDEVVGMLVTLSFLTLSYTGLAAGFVLFRIADIFKPSPVRLAEKLPGGWGVMADDVLAGIYANLTLRLFIHFFPGIL